MELLKEVIPKLSRVAFLTSTAKGFRTSIKETEVVAQALGLQLQVLQIRGADELEGAFDVAKKQGAGALLEAQATSLVPYQSRIIDLAAKNRLPTMYYNQLYVELGGLMSYGRVLFFEDRCVASMVDKILKGTKPADIPVEQPTKFELVINLKTARELGLTISPDGLMWADREIK